jgi:hypothetical protein
MAQLTYTRIDDNAARSVAAINTFWASATTQSTNITGPNWRDEGLDERLNSPSVAYSLATTPYIEYDTGMTAKNSAGAWATLVLGAVTFTLAGPWTQGQNVGVLRVRFASEWVVAIGAGHPTGVVTPSLSFRLVYQEDGGAVTVVPNSTRTFSYCDTVFREPITGDTRYIDNAYDNFKYSFLIPYTANNASHNLTNVSVQYNTSAAGYSIGRSTLTSAKLVRAVV